MKESSNASLRRRQESPYWNKVFTGIGLDIGSDDDLCNTLHLWKISTLKKFDHVRGDVNFIRQHFSDESFDFVHSSHLLEHMRRHPWHCCQDWACLLKAGGYLVITVPGHEISEKMTSSGRSDFDHSWAFHTETIEGSPWVLKMENIVAPLQDAGMEVLHVRRLTAEWDSTDNSGKAPSLEAGIGCAWEVLAFKRAHVFLRTPVSIRRQHALGDTIAVSALYNHLTAKHVVSFQTSPAYLDYHWGVEATSDLARNADIDLDGYDQANPYTPLYLLGFQKTGIPLPKRYAPSILVTEEERAEIRDLKRQKYVLIDISTVPIMSRSIWFDVLEVAEYLDGKGFAIKYLEACTPRNLIKVIGGASLVIGRDSGTTQLAQALETPFVSIMASVRSNARYIAGDNCRALCSPCPVGEDGCYHQFWLSRDCPIPVDGIAPCGIIPIKTMLQAIDEIISVADTACQAA